jgi:hypothetical protein
MCQGVLRFFAFRLDEELTLQTTVVSVLINAGRGLKRTKKKSLALTEADISLVNKESQSAFI